MRSLQILLDSRKRGTNEKGKTYCQSRSCLCHDVLHDADFVCSIENHLSVQWKKRRHFQNVEPLLREWVELWRHADEVVLHAVCKQRCPGNCLSHAQPPDLSYWMLCRTDVSVHAQQHAFLIAELFRLTLCGPVDRSIRAAFWLWCKEGW